MGMNSRAYGRWIFLFVLTGVSVFLIPGHSIHSQQPGRTTNIEVPQIESELPPIGNFYALVIGNDNYKSLPKLRTAVADAKAVATILTERYGFSTTLLLDADRQRILSVLSKYRRELEPTDNLLIYYAGHGHRDVVVDKAYWQPIDAGRDDNSNWISADDVTTNVKGMPARHVLIISDSCYSGMMYRDSESNLSLPAEQNGYFRRVITERSRHLLSSGTNEPVTDGGGGEHSVFARALLHGLDKMDRNIFFADDLFVRFIQERVAGNSEQLPQYTPLMNSGHEGGKFVFVRRVAPLVVLDAVSNALQETVMPGATFTQRIRVRNRGSAVARQTRADFVFSPDFELITATPSPINYDRSSRTAIWSLGDLDSRDNREITITLRTVPEALAAANRPIGRGTIRTASLGAPTDFDGPAVSVGRLPRAMVEALSAGMTATPGDAVDIPFFVRNPGNYPESYELRVVTSAPLKVITYVDTNGDGRHQESEPPVTRTPEIAPNGRLPVLLRAEVPRQAQDRQQFAYNLLARAVSAQGIIVSEASAVVTVAAPRVRVRTEFGSPGAKPDDTTVYRLVLANDGGALAKNLRLEELLPAGVESVEGGAAVRDAPGGAKLITRQFAELASGAVVGLPVRVKLATRARANADVRVTHTLNYEDANGNVYTQTATNSIIPVNVPVVANDAPSNAEQDAFNKGRDLFGQGKYEQAAASFNDFLKKSPNSFVADLMLLWLGRSYIELGRLEDAEQILRRLRAIRDTPFGDIFERELATARLGSKSRVDDGGPPPAERDVFIRGHRLYLDARFELAAAAFDGFLKSYPNSDITELVLTWLGRAHLAQGHFQDAEQVARRLQAFKGSPFFGMFSAELTLARSKPTQKGARPAPRQQVASVESESMAGGSRVTIISDFALNDYSAYRSGDRFYVVLPNVDARAAPPTSGAGFTAMQVQRRGDSAVLIFSVRPGVKPRVEQRFNRLDVVFALETAGQ